MKHVSRDVLVLFLIFVLLGLLLTGCSNQMKSPNGLYEAENVGGHYRVIEKKTGDVIFTTHPEFSTPNDVKAATFSPDSTKFAAAYHYSHDGGYTWIGVWDMEGNFLYARRKSGYTNDFSGVFN